MIPFKRMNFSKEYDTIKPLFESGNIGYGAVTKQFEQELAEYVGAKHVIAVNSCTTALMLSLMYERAKNGITSVSIPSMTMALVPNAVLTAGLDFTFNADTEWVGDRYELKGSHVIDSAHRLQRDDFKGLSDETKICYSFYPTKVIGSIDGGAIATNDDEFVEWVRSYIFYGRDQHVDSKNSWEFEIQMVGGKYNFNDVQAAMCLEQLRTLDDTHGKLEEINRIYNQAFAYTNNSDYLYRINVTNRDEFIDYMKHVVTSRIQGIECGVHFKPIHVMEPFKDHQFDGTIEERVEGMTDVYTAYSQTVSLPFFKNMTLWEISDVIDATLKYSGVILPQNQSPTDEKSV